MDYISQCKKLRRPLPDQDRLSRQVRRPYAHISCISSPDTWLRFSNKRQKIFSWRDEYDREKERFESALDKEAMAKDMLKMRLRTTTEREDWWLEAKHTSSRIDDDHYCAMELDDKEESHANNELSSSRVSIADWVMSVAADDADPVYQPGGSLWPDENHENDECAVADYEEEHDSDGENEHDSNEDDDDDDDNDTLYSRAFPDRLSPSIGFDHDLISEPRAAVDSNIDDTMMFDMEMDEAESEDIADEIQSSEMQGIEIQPELAPESSVDNDAQNQALFRQALSRHVQQAWTQYEKERLAILIDKHRTLRILPVLKESLPIFRRDILPCSQSSSTCVAAALERLTTKWCAAERTPLILLTTPDGSLFSLQETKQILTDSQIATIRSRRDAEQHELRGDYELYNRLNMAAIEGQGGAERLAVAAARAYWASEQEKRDADYVDWRHEEAREAERLRRQIEAEVETYTREKEFVEALDRKNSYAAQAKEGLVEDMASLVLKLEHERLVGVRNGWYVGDEYEVVFDQRMLDTYLANEERVDSLAVMMEMERQTEPEEDLDYHQRLEREIGVEKTREKRFNTWWKMRLLCQKRDAEIENRHVSKDGIAWTPTGKTNMEWFEEAWPITE